MYLSLRFCISSSNLFCSASYDKNKNQCTLKFTTSRNTLQRQTYVTAASIRCTTHVLHSNAKPSHQNLPLREMSNSTTCRRHSPVHFTVLESSFEFYITQQCIRHKFTNPKVNRTCAVTCTCKTASTKT